MCLIIHKPAGRTVPLSLMLEAFDNNGDGLGWMSAGEVDKVAHVHRRDVRRLTARLNKQLRDVEVAVHFRWRTHGAIDYGNTHPYPLANGGHLMHNGVLPCGSFYDPGMSDTWHYIAFDLHNAPADLRAPRWDDVEKDIGSGNKFAVMSPDGSMRILNKRAGRKYQGLWLSNTYSTPSLFRSRTTYTPATVSPGRYSWDLRSGGRVEYDTTSGRTYYWAPEAPPRGPAPIKASDADNMKRKALDALFRRQYGSAYAGTVTDMRTGERIAVDSDGVAIVKTGKVEKDYPGLVALANAGPGGPTLDTGDDERPALALSTGGGL